MQFLLLENRHIERSCNYWEQCRQALCCNSPMSESQDLQVQLSSVGLEIGGVAPKLILLERFGVVQPHDQRVMNLVQESREPMVHQHRRIFHDVRPLAPEVSGKNSRLPLSVGCRRQSPRSAASGACQQDEPFKEANFRFKLLCLIWSADMSLLSQRGYIRTVQDVAAEACPAVVCEAG
jgi:hypothetical protein